VSPLPAYILAGGQSRRFGSDKARALLEGRPLIVRLADQLRPLVAAVTVIAELPGKYADLGLSTLADEQPRLGPLGGLATALTHLAAQGGDPWLLLLSCDLVQIRPQWIARLQAHAHPPAQAVAFRGTRWEPLAALYHVSLLPLVQQQLGRDQRAMWSLLENARSTPLPLPQDWPAASQINTPQELDRLRANAGPSND
jgi:molybdopterin-guanine dinucleotide biosynthesis protein A